MVLPDAEIGVDPAFDADLFDDSDLDDDYADDSRSPCRWSETLTR